MVKELLIGMPTSGIALEPLVKEYTWSAIAVIGEDGGNGKPKFPWLWVGLGTAAAVSIVIAKKQLSD